MINELAEVLSLVVNCLNNLNIRYCVGGSVASGVRSQFRATLDIDILIEFLAQDILINFCNALREDFYIYDETALEAFSKEKSFNIIHNKFFLKVDIFTTTNDFSKSELARATLITLPNTNLEVKVATAEDMIINKLHWYQLGSCQSERQWNDLLLLVKYNKNKLDLDYLKYWANYKVVESLLDKLLGNTL